VFNAVAFYCTSLSTWYLTGLFLLCFILVGNEHQNDNWASKMTSSGAEDNSGGWNTRAKDSCTDGGKLGMWWC